jgi:diguanylate cyclase (GGDEF)-like protein/PAS domain S-box-containing protein
MGKPSQHNPNEIHVVSGAGHRSEPLRVLFVHRDADAIDSCVQELKKGEFIVSADFVLNLLQCAELVRGQSYDIVVAEHPGSTSKGMRELQLLHQAMQHSPLLLLTTAKCNESSPQLNGDGSVDYVDQEHLTQLPMAVRRLLSNKKLRADLEDTRTALRHSQSLYRALVDNPAYGIYRCDPQGTLLDVNRALITMLGYASKEELLVANQKLTVIPKLPSSLTPAGRFEETKRIDPVETEWTRKDGTTLRVRLSGRGIHDEHANFDGHEIIAVDVTEQRTLEDQLRHQASSDFLTGLGNHRRLFEALHAEICRAGRSGRDFSLLLLDLDGLKKINDQFGHLVGNRALCRLGQKLTDCCRSIDTAARHGGDEFAVVLPETTKAAAASLARRICEILENDTEDPLLSASIGIASYPRDGDTIGTLLYAADRALYAAKSKNPHAHQPVSAPTPYRMDAGSALSDIAHLMNAQSKEGTPHG